mmetsp:Transcript_10014/g.34043  ORF Transcript_10014/g.34043 Transcript_10014/m.34043 type:complete len:213 (-) Transcript_10014:419-1057(-)
MGPTSSKSPRTEHPGTVLPRSWRWPITHAPGHRQPRCRLRRGCSHAHDAASRRVLSRGAPSCSPLRAAVHARHGASAGVSPPAEPAHRTFHSLPPPRGAEPAAPTAPARAGPGPRPAPSWAQTPSPGASGSAGPRGAGSPAAPAPPAGARRSRQGRARRGTRSSECARSARPRSPACHRPRGTQAPGRSRPPPPPPPPRRGPRASRAGPPPQ